MTAGNANIAAAMEQHMAKQNPSSQVVLPMATADDLAKWERLGESARGRAGGAGFVEPGDRMVLMAGCWTKGGGALQAAMPPVLTPQPHPPHTPLRSQTM